MANEKIKITQQEIDDIYEIEGITEETGATPDKQASTPEIPDKQDTTPESLTESELEIEKEFYEIYKETEALEEVT